MLNARTLFHAPELQTAGATAVQPVSVPDAPGRSVGGSAALWGGLALLGLLIVAAALVAWRRRRHAAAHYAALLAHSQPRPAPAAAATTPTPTPTAPAPGAGEPRSSPPLSGVSAPPVSERQWQSQPPPSRGPKDPQV
jgi:hypothetical protein